MFSTDTPFGYRAVKGYFVDPIKDFLMNVRYLKAGGALEELTGKYPSGRDGLKVTEVAEAVERSIEEGTVVSL
jgi:hypothetical protein